MIEDFSPYLVASADWKLLPLPGGQTKYWTWLFPLTWGPQPAPGQVGGTGVPGRVMGEPPRNDRMTCDDMVRQ